MFLFFRGLFTGWSTGCISMHATILSMALLYTRGSDNHLSSCASVVGCGHVDLTLRDAIHLT